MGKKTQFEPSASDLGYEEGRKEGAATEWRFCKKHDTSYKHSAGKYCLYCHIAELEAEREGVVRVPVKPTEAMVDAGLKAYQVWNQKGGGIFSWRSCIRQIGAAMIAAAQQEGQ